MWPTHLRRNLRVDGLERLAVAAPRRVKLEHHIRPLRLHHLVEVVRRQLLDGIDRRGEVGEQNSSKGSGGGGTLESDQITYAPPNSLFSTARDKEGKRGSTFFSQGVFPEFNKD